MDNSCDALSIKLLTSKINSVDGVIVATVTSSRWKTAVTPQALNARKVNLLDDVTVATVISVDESLGFTAKGSSDELINNVSPVNSSSARNVTGTFADVPLATNDSSRDM